MNNLIDLIQNFTDTQLRGYQREVEVTQKFIDILEKEGIKYSTQDFTNYYPEANSATLTADGELINCLNTGFVGGVAKTEQIKLVDSLGDLNATDTNPNINYNPEVISEIEISRPCFYNSVSVAINKKDLDKVKSAKELIVKTEVTKTSYTSKNVLVGNITNPEKIIFAHMDTIGVGAVDNSTGTAFCLKYIIENKDQLDRILFVVSGNEEISYEFEPYYWGYGYRVFENEYKNLMDSTKQFIIADCIGYDKPLKITDEYTLSLGFPIANAGYYSKSLMLAGDLHKLMGFYHSEDDTIDKIDNNYLNEGYVIFTDLLKN